MDFSTAYAKLIELGETSPPWDFSPFDKDVLEAVAEDVALWDNHKDDYANALMDFLGWD